MKEFLEKLLSLILENPQNVTIKEKIEGNLTIYTLVVPKEEVGKVIGKEGKIINAIRTLCRLKASKTLQKVVIKVETPQ